MSGADGPWDTLYRSYVTSDIDWTLGMIAMNHPIIYLRLRPGLIEPHLGIISRGPRR